MSKCPQCKHSYTSKTHKTRCLRQPWNPKRRASTRSSGPDWGRVLSAPMASQSFYSDHSFEGEVIQDSTSPSEVTA